MEKEVLKSRASFSVGASAIRLAQACRRPAVRHHPWRYHEEDTDAQFGRACESLRSRKLLPALVPQRPRQFSKNKDCLFLRRQVASLRIMLVGMRISIFQCVYVADAPAHE